MKTRTNMIVIVVALLTYFCGIGQANAYYDPSTQRWLNRDPLGEVGFDASRGFQLSVVADGVSPFAFVGNNPPNYFDGLGLFYHGLPFPYDPYNPPIPPMPFPPFCPGKRDCNIEAGECAARGAIFCGYMVPPYMKPICAAGYALACAKEKTACEADNKKNGY